MNELHIHEVLRMMVAQEKTYNNKAEFIKDINEQFGEDVSFHACSSSGMDADAAFDFLIRKGKISVNAEENVGIDPEMTMCDEHPHDHPHNHSHEH